MYQVAGEGPASRGRAPNLLPRPCLGQSQCPEPHVPHHNSDAVLLQRGLVIGHFTHAHHGGSPVLLQVLGFKGGEMGQFRTQNWLQPRVLSMLSPHRPAPLELLNRAASPQAASPETSRFHKSTCGLGCLATGRVACWCLQVRCPCPT